MSREQMEIVSKNKTFGSCWLRLPFERSLKLLQAAVQDTSQLIGRHQYSFLRVETAQLKFVLRSERWQASVNCVSSHHIVVADTHRFVDCRSHLWAGICRAWTFERGLDDPQLAVSMRVLTLALLTRGDRKRKQQGMFSHR